MRPVACVLRVFPRQGDELRVEAWILNYSVGGCRLLMPGGDPPLRYAILDAQRLLVRVFRGLPYPWPVSADGMYSEVEVVLPDLDDPHNETRIVEVQHELVCPPAITVRLRARSAWPPVSG